MNVTQLSSTQKNQILSYITEEDEESNEITQSTCEAAIQFAEKTEVNNVPALSISATASGAISFYWEYGEQYFVADIYSQDLSKIKYQYQKGVYGKPLKGTETQEQIISRLQKIQQDLE